MYSEATDPLITVRDGAALLGCSVSTFWRRVSDGTIPPAIRIAGTTRWRRSDIEAVIARAVEARNREVA